MKNAQFKGQICGGIDRDDESGAVPQLATVSGPVQDLPPKPEIDGDELTHKSGVRGLLWLMG